MAFKTKEAANEWRRKYRANKRLSEPPKPPKEPLPFLEKKVLVHGTVKRKYHTIAQKQVTELLKQYR